MIVFWQALSKKIDTQGITSIMAWRAARRKTGLKVLAITLALTFVLPFLTWAFDPANFQIGLQSVLFDNHQVWVPKKIGTVQHTYQDGDRLVIHIQDLHCNYEVQMNIARILQRLTEKHGLRLISVEGTSLPISTAQIRTFPIKKIRQEVSDYFVRQGKLSGAEYYAATGEHTVLLEGVENARLYARNKKSVEFILKDEGQGYCFDLRDLLDSLKPGIYSPVLMKYDQQCRMYREGRVGVRQHSRFLKKIAKQLKIPFSSFSNLTAYLVSPHKLFPLNVDADQLFREIDLLDHLIRERFYTQNQEQELDQHLHRLDIIEKLLNISANTEELAEFRGHREAFRIPAFARFIREQDKSKELEVDSGIYLLDGYLNAAEDFYAVADTRSRYLADNTLARMAKHDETLAVLVTGGYHTRHILAALKTSGVSYLSIKPRLTKQDLVNPYFSLLKNRPTPLEKLLSQDQKIFTLEPYLPTIANPDRIPKMEELPEKNLRFAKLVEFFFFTMFVAHNFMRNKVIEEVQNQVTKTLSGRVWQNLIKFDVNAVRVYPNRVLSFTLTASNKKNMLALVWPHKGRLPLNEKILLEKAEFQDENIAVVDPENIAQVQAKLDAMSSWSLADLNLRKTIALYLAWRLLPQLLAGVRILTNLLAGIPERIRVIGERIAAWTDEYLPQMAWVQLAGMPGSRLTVQWPWLASVMEKHGSDVVESKARSLDQLFSTFFQQNIDLRNFFYSQPLARALVETPWPISNAEYVKLERKIKLFARQPSGAEMQDVSQLMMRQKIPVEIAAEAVRVMLNYALLFAFEKAFAKTVETSARKQMREIITLWNFATLTQPGAPTMRSDIDFYLSLPQEQQELSGTIQRIAKRMEIYIEQSGFDAHLLFPKPLLEAIDPTFVSTEVNNSLLKMKRLSGNRSAEPVLQAKQTAVLKSERHFRDLLEKAATLATGMKSSSEMRGPMDSKDGTVFNLRLLYEDITLAAKMHYDLPVYGVESILQTLLTDHQLLTPDEKELLLKVYTRFRLSRMYLDTDQPFPQMKELKAQLPAAVSLLSELRSKIVDDANRGESWKKCLREVPDVFVRSSSIPTTLPVLAGTDFDPQVNRCELEILAIAQEQGEVPGLHNVRDYYQRFMDQYPLAVIEQALQRVRARQPLNLSRKIQQVLSVLSKTKWIDSSKVETKIRALSRIEQSESACLAIILSCILDKHPKTGRKPKEGLFANYEIGELSRKGLSAFVERLYLWAYLNELAETDYFLTPRAIMLIFINNIQQKELRDYIRIFCDNETGPHGIAVLAGRAAERVLGKHRPLDETGRLLEQLRRIPKITMSAVGYIVGSRLTEAEIEKYFISQPKIAAGSFAQVERAIKAVMDSRREEEKRSLKDRSRIFINSLHDLKILDGPATWKEVELLLRAKRLPQKKKDQGKGFESEVILKVLHGIQAQQGKRLTKKRIEFISERTTLVRLREKQELIRTFYTGHQYAELSGEVLVALLLSPRPPAELKALLLEFSEYSNSTELQKMISSRHDLEMLSRFHSLMKERQLHASARAAGYSLDDYEQLKYFLDIISTGSFSREKVGRAFIELVRGKPRLEYILTLLKTGAVETENLIGFIQEHISPETQILIAKDLHWLYSQGNPLLADVRGGSPSGHDVKPLIALLNQLHGSNKLFTLLTLFLESDPKPRQRIKILELQFQAATAFSAGVVRAFVNKYPLGQVRKVLTRLRPEQVVIYDQLSILATLWQLRLEPDLVRKLEQAWHLSGSDHPDLAPLVRTSTKAYLKSLQNLKSLINSELESHSQILLQGAVQLLEREMGKERAAHRVIDPVNWLVEKKKGKTTRRQKPPVLAPEQDEDVKESKEDKTKELGRAIEQLSSDKGIAPEPGNEYIFMSALRDKYSPLAIHEILSAHYAVLSPEIPEEIQEIFTSLEKSRWLDEQEVKEAIQKLPRLERSIDQVFRILVEKIKDPANKTQSRFFRTEDADAIIARGWQFFQESLGLWSYLNQLSARGLSLDSWTIRQVFKAGMSPEEFNYYLTQMGWGETPRNDNQRFKIHEIESILKKNRPAEEFSALLEKLLQVPGLTTLKISYILGSHLTKQKIKLYFIKRSEKKVLSGNGVQAFIRASRKKKEEAQYRSWLLNALGFAKALANDGIIRDVVGMQAEIRRLASKNKQLNREVKISIIKYLLKKALENTQEKLEDKHYNEIATQVTLENILRKIPLLRLIFHDPRFINLSPDVIISSLKSSKSWETLQLLLEIYHKESTYEQSYIMGSNYTPDIIAQYYQRMKSCGLGSVARSTGYAYQKHREVAEALEIIEDHPDMEPAIKNRLFDELVHYRLSLEMLLLLISLNEIEKTNLKHYLCNYTTPDLRSEMILDLLWYYEQDNPLLRRGLQPTPSGKTPGSIKRLLVRLHGRPILSQFITLLLEEAAYKEDDTEKFNIQAAQIKNAQVKPANHLRIELALAYLKETSPAKLRERMSRVMPELAQFVDQLWIQATLNNSGLPIKMQKASEKASGIIISPYSEFNSLVVDNSLRLIKLLISQSAWVKALPEFQQQLLFRAVMARLRADKLDNERKFPEVLKDIRSQLEAAPITKFNKQVKEMFSALSSLESYPVFDGEVGDPYYYYLLLKAGVDAAAIEAALWIFRTKRDMPLNWTIVSPEIIKINQDMSPRWLREHIGPLKTAWQTDGREGVTGYLETNLAPVDREALVLLLWYLYNLNNIKGDQFNKNVWREIIELQEDMEVLDIGLIFTLIEFLLGPRIALQDIAAMKQDVVQSVQSNLPDVIKGLRRKGWQRGTLLTPSEAAAWRGQFSQQYDILLTDKIIHWFGWDASRDKEINKFLKRVSRHIGWEAQEVLARLQRLMPWEQDEKWIISQMLAMLPNDHFREFAEEDRELIAGQGWQVFVARWKVWKLAYEENPITGEYPSKDLLVSILLSRKTVPQIENLLDIYQMLEYLVHSESLSRDDWQNLIREIHPDESRAALELMLNTIGNLPKNKWSPKMRQAGLKRLNLDRVVWSYDLRYKVNQDLPYGEQKTPAQLVINLVTQLVENKKGKTTHRQVRITGQEGFLLVRLLGYIAAFFVGILGARGWLPNADWQTVSLLGAGNVLALIVIHAVWFKYRNRFPGRMLKKWAVRQIEIMRDFGARPQGLIFKGLKRIVMAFIASRRYLDQNDALPDTALGPETDQPDPLPLDSVLNRSLLDSKPIIIKLLQFLFTPQLQLKARFRGFRLLHGVIFQVFKLVALVYVGIRSAQADSKKSMSRKLSLRERQVIWPDIPTARKLNLDIFQVRPLSHKQKSFFKNLLFGKVFGDYGIPDQDGPYTIDIYLPDQLFFAAQAGPVNQLLSDLALWRQISEYQQAIGQLNNTISATITRSRLTEQLLSSQQEITKAHAAYLRFARRMNQTQAEALLGEMIAVLKQQQLDLAQMPVNTYGAVLLRNKLADSLATFNELMRIMPEFKSQPFKLTGKISANNTDTIWMPTIGKMRWLGVYLDMLEYIGIVFDRRKLKERRQRPVRLNINAA